MTKPSPPCIFRKIDFIRDDYRRSSSPNRSIVQNYYLLFQVVFVAVAFLAMTSAKPSPNYLAAPIVSAAYTAPIVSAYSAPLVYSDVATSVVSEPLVSSYYSPYAYAYYYR